MGVDPIWLGIMIAINLQTSFLTPPFVLPYFICVVWPQNLLLTSDIYRGVIPFISIQLLLLIALAIWPNLATWLPHYLYG